MEVVSVTKLLLRCGTLLCLVITAAAQEIPKELLGKWQITRILPTSGLSCWGDEEAQAIVGTEIEYGPSTLRWKDLITRYSGVSVRQISAQQFHDENSGQGRNSSQITFAQLGIEKAKTIQIDIKHPAGDVTGATTEIPGDSVLLKDQNTIVFSVCGISFAAERVPTTNPQSEPSSGRQAGTPPAIAGWKPHFENDNELFPSVVLAMSGRKFNTRPDSRMLGDPIGMAGILIRSSVPNAHTHVVIQIDGFSAASDIDVTLPAAGQLYNVMPTMRYDFQRLAALDQSVPANVSYSVSVNGTDLGKETLPIRVRSVNDVPFLAQGPDGKSQDLSVLFAAYVDESHPFVDRVLQEALNYHAVNEFVGYQRGPDAVRLQVFALWNVLQRRHIRYSSITTPSAASPSGHTYSQSVRFIDQSIASQQANCVDGSVLFASLLYKIGIQPVLVHKPGHMFVGYYLDAGRKQLEFLETTMLGAGSQPSAMNIGFSTTLHPVQGSESWKQFIQAVEIGDKTFNTEVQPALQQHTLGYSVIDIAKARQAGINSIPRASR
jgi:hypothetical protein